MPLSLLQDVFIRGRDIRCRRILPQLLLRWALQSLELLARW